jgi:sulfur carrier protein
MVVEIRVNGESKTVEDGASVAELMAKLGYERSARGVAVAVNDAVVPQPSWHEKALAEGDSIEIIRAVQGG